MSREELAVRTRPRGGAEGWRRRAARCRARTFGTGRLPRRRRGALPAPLAVRPPRRLARRPRRGRRGGHRAGGLRLRPARPGPLRPPPPARPLAAQDRGQLRDRLVARTRLASRDRRRHAPGRRVAGVPPGGGRTRRGARRPRPRAPRRRGPAPPARLHPGRDRGDARPAAR